MNIHVSNRVGMTSVSMDRIRFRRQISTPWLTMALFSTATMHCHCALHPGVRFSRGSTLYTMVNPSSRDSQTGSPVSALHCRQSSAECAICLTFKAHWLLYVPAALTYSNSALYPHRVYGSHNKQRLFPQTAEAEACCWHQSARSLLVLGPMGTHDHIRICSSLRSLRVFFFLVGPLFRKEKELFSLSNQRLQYSHSD
jgi:hypothetical protein